MQKTKKAKKAVSKKAKEEVKAEEAPAEEAQMDTDDDEKAEAKIVAADGDIKPKRKATKTAAKKSSDESSEDEEENSNSTEEEQDENDGDEEKTADSGPPAKKSKKLDKKTGKKPEELTEDEILKRKLIKMGDIIRCKASREKQTEVLQELKTLLEGKYLKFAYNHVISRVIEWMIKLSKPDFTAALVLEMKSALKTMAKMKYSTHVVSCLIEKSDRPTFEIIHSELASEVIKMLLIPTSSTVVGDLFTKSSNEQKQVMKHKFYGNSFKIFKAKDVETLKDVSRLSPTERDSIFNEINDNLNKVIEKDSLKSALTVSVLRDYLEVIDSSSAKHAAFIAILQNKFVELGEFKEGSWLAARCLWNSSAKERKQIMKSCKEKLKNLAMTNVGSMILMTLMDCVDDTTLINKIILQPLLEDCVSVSSNVHGVRVLAFSVRPRSTHFIHPETIKFLQEGDANQHSKKDHALRQKEIKNFVVPIVAPIVGQNLSPWIQDAQRFLFMKAFLENSEFAEVREVMENFANLLSDPEHFETSTFKGVESTMLMVEMPFAQKLAMHLIKEDKRRFSTDSTYKPVFCELLIEKIKECPSLWLKSNRGVLTFLCMMETEIPVVVEEVKEMLVPHIIVIKPLAEGKNKSAQDLLKLLADSKKVEQKSLVKEERPKRGKK